MKKIFFLALLFFCSSAFASFDWNKSFVIHQPVTMVIDAGQNTCSLRTQDQNYIYPSLVSGVYPISLNYSFVLTQQDIPFSDFFNPILAYCNQNQTTDNNILGSLSNILAGTVSCDTNSLEKNVSAFANSLDGSLSRHFDDLYAYMSNTVLPSQAQIQQCQTDSNRALSQCLVDKDALNGQIHDLKTENDLKNNQLADNQKTIADQKSQIDFWQLATVACLVLLAVVVLGVLAERTGLFQRIREGQGEP